MIMKRIVAFGVLALALAPNWGCQEIRDSVTSATKESTADEERDLFYVAGTRFAESVPGTDLFYVYEVRFTRPGDEVVYTLEELTSMEEQGFLLDEDPIDQVWIRSETPVPGSEILGARTVLRFNQDPEGRPGMCPRCWTWDSVNRVCECGWGCVKCLFR